MTISNLMNNVFSTFGFQQFARRALPATLPCYFVSLIPSQGFNNFLCPVHASQDLDRSASLHSSPSGMMAVWVISGGRTPSSAKRLVEVPPAVPKKSSVMGAVLDLERFTNQIDSFIFSANQIIESTCHDSSYWTK